ncbi:MAG: 30S ribosomal protein S6 [Gemmataceae bacterium]|nr:30S ribosomal protein S6 [Gemmataceae bacterium]
MPVQMYEFLLMLDSSKVAGDLEGTKQTLKAMFEKHHAEVLASRPWDERKLAYPVSKQKKALFHLNYIKADTQMVKDIEHDLKLNENVLRFMSVRIEPKLQETMLALALDPRALALQAANEDVVDEFEMGGRG